MLLGVSTTLLLLFDKEVNYITSYGEKIKINGRLLSKQLKLAQILNYQINDDKLRIIGVTKNISADLSLIEDASKKELIMFLEKCVSARGN